VNTAEISACFKLAKFSTVSFTSHMNNESAYVVMQMCKNNTWRNFMLAAWTIVMRFVSPRK